VPNAEPRQEKRNRAAGTAAPDDAHTVERQSG
jgi:hypothetical protein